MQTPYRPMNPSDLGMSYCDAASATRLNGLSVLQSQDLLTTPLAVNHGGYSSGGNESVPQRDALRRAEDSPLFFNSLSTEKLWHGRKETDPINKTELKDFISTALLPGHKSSVVKLLETNVGIFINLENPPES